MTVSIVPATPEHVVALQLCEEDRAECELMNPGAPAEASLRLSWAASVDPMAAVEDATGEVLTIFGVVISGGYAVPWMLSSAGIRRHPLRTLRIARGVLQFWRWAYQGLTLSNQISKHHTLARRFITKLGAVITPGAGEVDNFHFPNV